jgi:hypothetical protein
MEITVAKNVWGIVTLKVAIKVQGNAQENAKIQLGME